MLIGTLAFEEPEMQGAVRLGELCGSLLSPVFDTLTLARLMTAGRSSIGPKSGIRAAERLGGKFVVHSNDGTLSTEDMALGYKQLQRVEQAWCQLKCGPRLRPVYHRAVHRIHARIALTVMWLLLERMAEHACADPWRKIRDDLKGIRLAQLIGPNGTL